MANGEQTQNAAPGKGRGARGAKNAAAKDKNDKNAAAADPAKQAPAAAATDNAAQSAAPKEQVPQEPPAGEDDDADEEEESDDDSEEEEQDPPPPPPEAPKPPKGAKAPAVKLDFGINLTAVPPAGTPILYRTNSRGVWAGKLKSHAGAKLVLGDARRIWEWEGSLSGMAISGPTGKAKLLAPVKEVTLESQQLEHALKHEKFAISPEAWPAIVTAPVFRHA